jgi:predicted alpha/beta hydrolase family esterase
VLVLPGYGGSGAEHWQTLWERAHPEFRRVEARDWEHPDRAEWVAALDAAVRATGAGIVLVAHSLACLQVVHFAAEHPDSARAIRAALLVAPPDPKAPVFPAVITGFDTVPMNPLPFPAIVVGSTNDPYGTPEFTATCAKAWGARFVSVGAKGHVNAASGLGAWEEGWELLKSLEANA